MLYKAKTASAAAAMKAIGAVTDEPAPSPENLLVDCRVWMSYSRLTTASASRAAAVAATTTAGAATSLF